MPMDLQSQTRWLATVPMSQAAISSFKIFILTRHARKSKKCSDDKGKQKSRSSAVMRGSDCSPTGLICCRAFSCRNGTPAPAYSSVVQNAHIAVCLLTSFMSVANGEGYPRIELDGLLPTWQKFHLDFNAASHDLRVNGQINGAQHAKFPW